METYHVRNTIPLPSMIESSNSAFRYMPLGRQPGTIPLLVLEPGLGDIQLHCHLENVSIDRGPEDLHDRVSYTALSYVWGGPRVIDKNYSKQPSLLHHRQLG